MAADTDGKGRLVRKMRGQRDHRSDAKTWWSSGEAVLSKGIIADQGGAG